ncbi:MAG: hypothetical protein ACREXU_06950, partial [Gammaproteobacteria bacterium]
VLGSHQPIATWELPEGVDGRFRSVRYEPQGFPTPDAPVRRTTWFRVVATPLGFDPVEIFVGANTRIADMPIRTTSLGVRLTIDMCITNRHSATGRILFGPCDHRALPRSWSGGGGAPSTC